MRCNIFCILIIVILLIIDMCSFFDALFGNEIPKKTSIKIALIGDGSTGKTSYFDRITSGDSPDYRFNKHYDATQGCNICQIEMLVGEVPVTLHLFDTAGQEKFGMLRDSYLMGADGIILMYDVMDKSSKQNVISRWLPEIRDIIGRARMSDVPVAVVGNKYDKPCGKNPCPEVLGFRRAVLMSNYDSKYGSIDQQLISVRADHNLMAPIVWLLRNILKVNSNCIGKSDKKPFIMHCNK